jgi:hypothetical protein
MVVHDDGEDKFLAIQRDGVQALEQLVLARYYMTKQVYRHRIRTITDEMIGRAISLGIESDGIGWLKDLYRYDGSNRFIENYLQWNDDRLITRALEEPGDTYLCSIFKRLAERRLLKCIYEKSAERFVDAESKQALFAGIYPNELTKEVLFAELEKLIAERWNFDKNLVICHLIKFKSAIKTESEILVVAGGRKPTLFQDESAIFRTANESIQEQYLQVFAPWEYKDERDKKRCMAEFSTEIESMIKQILRAEPASTGNVAI